MQKLVFINGAGKQIDLTSGNFGITKWEGLSNTGLNIQTQQVLFEDGGVFLDALMEEREIELTVAIQDNNNLELRYQKKRELISALNPKVGEGTLIYTNDYLSRQIKAVPQIPIFENKNSNDAGTLKASVVFSCPSPYWEDIEEKEIFLQSDIKKTIENEGDYISELKVELLNENAVNPKIENLANGGKIQLIGTFNDIVKANTNVGQKSIVSESIINHNKIIGANIQKIIYGKNGFVAIGTITESNTKGYVLTSPDLKNWNAVLFNTKLTDIIYCKEKNIYVISGNSGSQYFIYTSSDLVTFNTVSMDQKISKILYNKTDDLFVALGDSYIYSSSDLETWTNVYYMSTEFADIIYSEKNNFYVGIINGTVSSFIRTSTDLENWTNVFTSSAEGLQMRKIGCVDNLGFVVVGYKTSGNGNYAIGAFFFSSDGSSWQEGFSLDEEIKGSFVYVDGSESTGFFAICYTARDNISKVITSRTGASWLVEKTSNQFYNAINYIKEYGDFVASGDYFAIETILNNDIMIDAFNGQVNDILYVEDFNLYIIATSVGIYTSPDGEKMTKRFSMNATHLAYSPKLKKIICTGSSSIKYVKSNNGIDWEEGSDLIGSYGFNCALWVDELEKFFITGYGVSEGYVYYSVDGDSFERAYNNTTQIPSLIFPRDISTIDFSIKSHLLLLSTNGGIFTSALGEGWV